MMMITMNVMMVYCYLQKQRVSRVIPEVCTSFLGALFFLNFLHRCSSLQMDCTFSACSIGDAPEHGGLAALQTAL